MNMESEGSVKVDFYVTNSTVNSIKLTQAMTCVNHGGPESMYQECVESKTIAKTTHEYE